MNNFKILKLVSGEDIVCTIENYSRNIRQREYIVVKNPVLLNQVRIPRGPVIVESYILSPWVALSPNEEFEIPTQHIIVVSDAKETLQDNYNTFIESRKNNLESADTDDDSDFDLDETIDNFLKRNESEDDAEDEIETYRGNSSGRTIH